MVKHAVAKQTSHTIRYDLMEECNASDMPEQVLRLRGRQICQTNTQDMEMALEQ